MRGVAAVYRGSGVCLGGRWLGTISVPRFVAAGLKCLPPRLPVGAGQRRERDIALSLSLLCILPIPSLTVRAAAPRRRTREPLFSGIFGASGAGGCIRFRVPAFGALHECRDRVSFVQRSVGAALVAARLLGGRCRGTISVLRVCTACFLLAAPPRRRKREPLFSGDRAASGAGVRQWVRVCLRLKHFTIWFASPFVGVA